MSPTTEITSLGRPRTERWCRRRRKAVTCFHEIRAIPRFGVCAKSLWVSKIQGLNWSVVDKSWVESRRVSYFCAFKALVLLEFPPVRGL